MLINGGNIEQISKKKVVFLETTKKRTRTSIPDIVYLILFSNKGCSPFW